MPRDWNAAYENEDTPWDKGEASPPLREFLSKRCVEGRVLVPGCGTGHDVRLLAKQGAEVVGMDIAPNALRLAEQFAKVSSEIYVLGDFLNLPEDHVGIFDFVVEHTCLCALEPDQREDYAAAVVKTLKPGGHLLAVFFREVSNYDGNGPPHPISAEQIEALFGEPFECLERFVPKQSYASRPIGAEEVCLLRKL